MYESNTFKHSILLNEYLIETELQVQYTMYMYMFSEHHLSRAHVLCLWRAVGYFYSLPVGP